MKTEHYIGLMSGTSLDGVDGVLVAFTNKNQLRVIENTFIPYPESIKQAILALQNVGTNEIDQMYQLGNQLSEYYAEAVNGLLNLTKFNSSEIQAIGCHGQTIRHAPNQGYTVQIGNLAKLAELTNITTIGDFRSRDIAAGGQGAPLVPAFHQQIFSDPHTARGILNIGGIANLTVLEPQQDVIGFDIGPGNMLMDAWIQTKQHKPFDKDGEWAKEGQVQPTLLQHMLNESFFTQTIPKSTGRDLFNLTWLQQCIDKCGQAFLDQDIQATLLELTAISIQEATQRFAPNITMLYLCGGGALNLALVQSLKTKLPNIKISLTDTLGLPTQLVEASAFAWLAKQTMHQLPSNLPSATGSKGLRVLGAIYAK